MTDRSEYMKEYASTHNDEARERKQAERDRRERCRSYWYARLILNRDMPYLIHDCSHQMIEQERKKYEMTLAETK